MIHDSLAIQHQAVTMKSEDIDMNETTRALLTPELESLLGQYIEILTSIAHSHQIPVTATTVDDIFDYETGLPVIIVTQYVATDMRVAMNFEKEVSWAMAKWRDALSDTQRKVASQQLVFEARWAL